MQYVQQCVVTPMSWVQSFHEQILVHVMLQLGEEREEVVFADSFFLLQPLVMLEKLCWRVEEVTLAPAAKKENVCDLLLSFHHWLSVSFPQTEAALPFVEVTHWIQPYISCSVVTVHIKHLVLADFLFLSDSNNSYSIFTLLCFIIVYIYLMQQRISTHGEKVVHKYGF